MKREKTFTPSTLRIILKLVKSPRDIFMLHLLSGAFFFAMRSCVHVKKPSEPRSQIVTSLKIQFFKNQDKKLCDTPFLEHSASSIQETFGKQKKLHMEELASNYSTKKDLCLFRSWKHVIRQLSIQYPKTLDFATRDFIHCPITLADIAH